MTEEELKPMLEMVETRLREVKDSMAAVMLKQHKLSLACQLVLLFHEGGPWDNAQQQEWRSIMTAIRPGFDDNCEATTKTLCSAIRAALE